MQTTMPLIWAEFSLLKGPFWRAKRSKTPSLSTSPSRCSLPLLSQRQEQHIHIVCRRTADTMSVPSILFSVSLVATVRNVSLAFAPSNNYFRVPPRVRSVLIVLLLCVLSCIESGYVSVVEESHSIFPEERVFDDFCCYLVYYKNLQCGY